MNKNIKVEEHKEFIPLAEGYIVPATGQTGNNILVTGGTRSGKTYSILLPECLNNYTRSMVVSFTKDDIRKRIEKKFKNEDYCVEYMDFQHLERSTAVYDPMTYVSSDDDAISLAGKIMETAKETDDVGEQRYWVESAKNILASLIMLAMMNARKDGRKASFADVILLYKALSTLSKSGGKFKSTLDGLFETSLKYYPGNQAYDLWAKTVVNEFDSTLNNKIGVLASIMSKICSDNYLKMLQTKRAFDFASLGQKKTILFVSSSVYNTSSKYILNLAYSDMFESLLRCAEEEYEGILPVPVNIACDDFACTGRIPNFDKHISVFCAAGISVTILLQSESQLKAMYGVHSATTIINNCNTYIYTGGTDLATCESVAKRADKPLEQIVNLKEGYFVVCRRGYEPVIARRYQTMDDPEYKKLMSM